MHGAFLQSPEWEHLNREMGRKTWRINGVLVIRHDLPHGFNYLYCPRPRWGTSSIADFITQAWTIARTEQSIFLKIDPVEPLPLKDAGVRREEGTPLQPQRTVILDLSKSEDELMAAMHEKTRYNIRLAERKGIEMVQALHRGANEDVSVFLNLLSETATRGGFRLHQKKYYELLARVRTDEMSNELFFAHRKGGHGPVLAAALVNIHHDPQLGLSTATYLHGASSRDHRELMSPHLLHWRIIQEMKRRSIHYYDLWGIDEKRWPGVTRFKTGFGGLRIDYPPSAHIIYRPAWYIVYKLAKQSIRN